VILIGLPIGFMPDVAIPVSTRPDFPQPARVAAIPIAAMQMGLMPNIFIDSCERGFYSYFVMHPDELAWRPPNRYDT
jgi:hypothetical protein